MRARTWPAPLALTLALALAGTACVPAAIGTMVVGTAAVVTGVVEYEDCHMDDNKDGPAGALCGLSNVLPMLLVLLGSGMIVGGGIALAR